MKKLAMFFLLLIIIIVGISYLYFNYKANYYETKRNNNQFESYAGQEIYGTELGTIMNKAINNNEINEVLKDEQGNYRNNDKNSLQIDIKMLDNDKTYSMETFQNGTGGMQKFVQFYNEIKFRCSKIEYHQTTNKVKYMLFEQITQ